MFDMRQQFLQRLKIKDKTFHSLLTALKHSHLNHRIEIRPDTYPQHPLIPLLQYHMTPQLVVHLRPWYDEFLVGCELCQRLDVFTQTVRSYVACPFELARPVDCWLVPVLDELLLVHLPMMGQFENRVG